MTYAQDILEIPAETLERQLKMVFLAMIVFGGLTLGSLADIWGYRMGIMVQGVFLIGAFCAALISRGRISLLVAYGLYVCTHMTVFVMFSNLSVELMPRTGSTRS